MTTSSPVGLAGQAGASVCHASRRSRLQSGANNDPQATLTADGARSRVAFGLGGTPRAERKPPGPAVLTGRQSWAVIISLSFALPPLARQPLALPAPAPRQAPLRPLPEALPPPLALPRPAPQQTVPPQTAQPTPPRRASLLPHLPCGVPKYDLAAKEADPGGGRVYAPHTGLEPACACRKLDRRDELRLPLAGRLAPPPPVPVLEAAAYAAGVVGSRHRRRGCDSAAGLGRILGVPASARAGCASSAFGAVEGA